MNRIQFQEKRQLSAIKQQIFYMANHIKFYSINSELATIFYFLTQSLALISTFSVSPVFSNSNPIILFINQINTAFFFYSSSVYQSLDQSLIGSHCVSLVLLVIFSIIGYTTYTINFQNRILLSKADSNKIQLTRLLVFVLISLNIPLGSFIAYYFIRLITNGMEYLVLLPFINLLLLSVVVYIMEECSIETDLKNYTALSRLYNKNEGLQAIVKMVVRMVMTCFDSLPSNVIVLSVLILLVFDLYQLRITIFSKKYLNSTTESIYSFKNICVVIVQVLMIICLVSQMPLIIDNFFLAAVSTSTLAFVSLMQFKNYNKRELTFGGLEAMKTEDDAKIYMLQSIGMLSQTRNNQEILALGLITIHMQYCTVSWCFCKQYGEQANKQLVKKGEFLKQFVLYKLEQVVLKFEKSFLIISILINYKLSFLGSFSRIFDLLKHYIQQNQENLTSFSEQYMLYQMQVIIEKSIGNNYLANSTRADTQRVFRQDDMKKELTGLLTNINQKLLEKYKLLSQEICNLNMIENICDEVTDCVRKVEQLWQIFKKDDSYNIKIYEVFLVYFEYLLHFRKQVVEVKNTILRKTQTMLHLKGISNDNLERYLYSNRACVLEVTASNQKVGIITNVSTSCQNVFKITKDRLIGKGIHEVMPEYLVNAHRRWSKQWIDEQKLTGKLLGIVNTYYLDVNGNCFSACLNMKIVSVGFRLKFYVMMIRDNSEDYLLLSDNLQIQGYGERLQSEHIFSKWSLKMPFSKYCQLDLKKEMGQSHCIKRRVVFTNDSSEVRQTKIAQTYKNISFSTISNQRYDEVKARDMTLRECEVIISRIINQGFTCYTVKFLEIKKLARRQTIPQTIKTGRVSINHHNSSNSSAKNNQDQNSKYTEMAQQIYVQSSAGNQEEYDEMQKYQAHNNISSFAESSVGEANTVFGKLIDQIKEKTIDFRKSHDSRIGLVTCVVFFLCLTVIVISWVQCYVLGRGIHSFREVMMANSFLSQNMILLQLNYNNQLAMKTYCLEGGGWDVARCQFLSRSASDILQLYYESSLSNTEKYLKSKTYLSSILLYSEQQNLVNVKLGNLTTPVNTREFMQYFYYALHSLIYKTPSNPKVADSLYNQSYQFMASNWYSMKESNKHILEFYQAAGAHQLNILQSVILGLSGAYLLLVLLLMICCKLYFMYKQNKKEQVMKLYSYLNRNTCNVLKQSNQIIRTCLKTSYSDVCFAPARHNMQDSKQKTQTKYSKHKKVNYFVVVFVTVLISCNIAIVLQSTSLIQPANTILGLFKQLTKAETDSFQTYLQLKAFYLSYNFSLTPSELYSQLVGFVNSSDVRMASYGKQVVTAFYQLDSSIRNTLNEYLVHSVCSVVQPLLLNQMQMDKCQRGMNFGVMDEGMVAAMSYYQRNTYEALLNLTYGNITDTTSYFKSRVFQDMDDYIFYMYLMFELIQNSLAQGVGQAANKVIFSITYLMVIEIALMGLLLSFWLVRLSGEKKNLSNLYGAVLQLPHTLFKENKIIMHILKDNLCLKY